jgi:hypothetical protein
LGEVFLEWLNEWYDDGLVNARARELLFEHIMSATHVNGDYVYQAQDGNPSGNPFTSIYNSFLNIMMCYIILTEKFGCNDDEFELAVYGDDNVIAVKREGLRVSDFTPHFKELFGMDYTHWSKSEHSEEDSISTIRYLGRAFVPDLAVVRAPLDENVVVETFYWVRNGVSPREAVMANFRNYCLEFSHFELNKFNYEINVLMDHIRNTPELNPLYTVLDRQIRQSYYFFHKLKYEDGDQPRNIRDYLARDEQL